MSAIDGQWFDGRTSHMRPLRLRVTQDGMLEGEGEAGLVQWPLAEVRISPRLGSTPRILRLPDGGRIECADAPLFAQWFPSPPSRVEAFADWLERRRVAIAAAAIATVVATVLFVQFGLPWVAQRGAERMPAGVERRVSDQAVALLERIHLRPTALSRGHQARLRTAFAAMVAGEPRADRMRLRFVRAPALGPNAFALPDGRIYVTDELVVLARSDRRVLAVLAHEAGHHVHRHGMRQALESSSVFVLAGLVFGDATGSSLAVSVPAALLSNRFSRGHEREADDYAFELLRRRGHSPRDFAEVMRRLSAGLPAGIEEGAAGYLSSHPPSPERIRAAEQAAARK